jgi:hypothetical protein
MIFNPNEYSVVFLSYDEPNCDENFQHLLKLKPDCLRVHGVKGSDTAHKKVAEISLTKNVIIVDGDNYVNDDFFQNTIELNDDVDLSISVLSFSGKNCINGTQYGNGGIKIWPVDLIKNMRTHENSDRIETKVDFHLEKYHQLNCSGSTVVINSSPKQAWRAGFRDGVKLCLNNLGIITQLDDVDWRNFDRLWNWTHIGQDVENGLWAIYGARLGVYMTVINKFDYTRIENFDYLDTIFDPMSTANVLEECNRLGKLINHPKITDVWSSNDSKRYKETVKPVYRSPESFLKEPLSNEYDIVFISYYEPNSDYNYKKLCERFPRAKRINGVRGIHQAHIEAAKLCETDYIWIVDGDAEIVNDFNFDYVVPFFHHEVVRVWRSKNPINDLVYGYGGVKLLPRTSTIRMNKDKPDMTTSICKHYEPIMVISNITRFNTDSFNTWRSAFRECCKLSSQVINNQVTDETKERLDVWCGVGRDKLFGDFAIEGAISGRMYGYQNRNDLIALRKINDFDWMKENYDRFYDNTVE